jgi:succinate dehydrogenase / fumarate reductase, cytochrome b subunit
VLEASLFNNARYLMFTKSLYVVMNRLLIDHNHLLDKAMAVPSNRPTSPHLHAYKLPLTGIISITHRMTGVLLSIGLVCFVVIMSAIAGGQQSYDNIQSLAAFWPIKLIYWGFSYALVFHLCHGVRHLIWDAGKGFDRETMDRYALIEMGISLAMTINILLFI